MTPQTQNNSTPANKLPRSSARPERAFLKGLCAFKTPLLRKEGCPKGGVVSVPANTFEKCNNRKQAGRLFYLGILLLSCLPLTGGAKTGTGDQGAPVIEKIPVEGKNLTLKVPVEAAPGKPWLWVGEFGGHLKALEAELLDRGWHVAYLPFSNKFGAPAEIDLWEKAYERLHRERGLAPRPALLGISRGGLYVNAWTRRHPDRVSVLYLDNGVCDPRSWPGGFELTKKGRGSARDWKRYKEIFDFPSDEEALAQTLDPVAGFEAALRNDVLLISVHGTADGTVPYEDNAKRLVDLWKKSGGRVEVFAKEGGRHHPHGLPDVAPLVQLLTGERQQ